jgi:hypothetical protein
MGAAVDHEYFHETIVSGLVFFVQLGGIRDEKFGKNVHTRQFKPPRLFKKQRVFESGSVLLYSQ